MRAYLRRRMATAQEGQAMVETAIVTPLMVGFILGIIQLTMMHQASLMLEYAAFNAARTGAVWNMDKDRMNTAAFISLLPTMKPTPTIETLLTTAVTQGLKQLILEKLGMPMVNVEVMSPKKADFNGAKELEFDNTPSAAARKKTQMTVRVVYLYELRIPFANLLIWESYWSAHVGQNLRSIDPSMAFIGRDKMWMSRLQKADFTKSCKYTGLNSDEMYKLRWAATAHQYYLPLVTTYTIRMQSNPFLHKPGNSSELWAAPDKDDCG